MSKEMTAEVSRCLEKMHGIIDLIDDQIENRGKYLTPETKLQAADAELRKKRNRKFTEQTYTEFGIYINPKSISPY